jgi:hypothetical protein
VLDLKGDNRRLPVARHVPEAAILAVTFTAISSGLGAIGHAISSRALHKPIRKIDTSLVADSDDAFVLIEVNLDALNRTVCD